LVIRHDSYCFIFSIFKEKVVDTQNKFVILLKI
jgi:hypothetical protein